MAENNLLEKSILATIAYYDGLNFPLTLWELRKNPADLSRFFGEGQSPKKISLAEILNLLETSDLLKKNLGERDGFYFLASERSEKPSASHFRASDKNKNSDFYFLKGGENAVAQRIERQKISEQMWKKARRYSFLFHLVPFLKFAFVSGSLALNNAGKNSDIDLLLVSKSGRIWTCRFFALLSLAVFGVLRRGEKIAGRFCLNHFIADDFLEIKNQSLYNARTYANFVPFIVRDKNVLAEFWKKNDWIKNYILNFNPPRSDAINFHTVAGKGGRSGSLGGLGNLTEKLLAFLQKRRIEKDPRTKKSGGRVITDDSRLEFHPDSPESRILADYNKKMKYLGFSELANEKDSGLLTGTEK